MIKLENINLTGGKKELLRNAKFEAQYGDVTLIFGESGCGKSTLLYEIGLLSEHKDISYFINDIDVRNMQDNETLNLKRFEIGYVFQNSELFNEDTVLYNINHFAGMVNKTLDKGEINEYLKLLRLHIRLDQKVKTLSGGERQRLAIMCALLKDSSILILDEVTSALDNENEEKIFQILQDISKANNIAVILVSHSLKAKDYADAIYEFENLQLICKKTSNSDGKYEMNLSRSLKLPILHFLHYCLAYIKKYWLLNVLLFIAVLSGLTFVSFTDSYFKYYNMQVLNDIENLSYNEIWIHSTKYQDDSSNSLNNSILKDVLDNIDIEMEVFTYFEGTCQINDKEVKIIPFYANQKNSRFIAKKTQVASSIYASDLYFLDDKEIYEQISINDKRYYFEGVFKTGSRFYNSGNMFIATTEDIAKIIDPFIQYNGYIVRTTSFSDLKTINDIAGKNSLTCKSSLQDIEVLSQYQRDANKSMTYYKIGTTAFVVMLITLFYFIYYRSRRKELAFLKVNGYTNKQITYILALENFVRLLVCFIPSLILNLIINHSILFIDTQFTLLIINTIITVLIVAFIPHMLSIVYVYNLKPIEIYRT